MLFVGELGISFDAEECRERFEGDQGVVDFQVKVVGSIVDLSFVCRSEDGVCGFAFVND